MSKKTIIIISAAVVLLLVVFFAAAYGIKKYQFNQAEPSAEEQQKASENQGAAPTGVKPKTIEQKEIEVKQEEATFSKIISNSENIADCDALSADYKQGCVFNVLINQAKSKLDSSLCSAITEKYYRDNCLAQVEQAREAKAATEKIQAVKTQEERFKQNTAYEDALEYQDGKTLLPDKTMAEYMQLIFSYNDSAYCKYLPEYKIQECNDLLAMHQAEIKEDIAACQYVKSDYWKNKCIITVTIKKAHHDLNPALCQSLLGADKTECLKGL